MSKLYPILSNKFNNRFHLFSNFDFLFDNIYNDDNSFSTRDSSSYMKVPRANVTKGELGYTIELAAPGFSREDFELDVKNNKITVHVGTTDGKDYEDNLVAREWSYNSFTRAWSLPEETNIDGISARYEAGILYIEVPTEGKKDIKRTIMIE